MKKYGLEEKSFKVDTFNSAESAIAFERHTPAIIILYQPALNNLFDNIEKTFDQVRGKQ